MEEKKKWIKKYSSLEVTTKKCSKVHKVEVQSLEEEIGKLKRRKT